MSKQRSKAWRAAEYIGLVEDPSAAPQRGSRAWWRRVWFIGAAVVAVVAATTWVF